MWRLLALLAVAGLVNLPWAHQTWVDHRVDADGRDVTAVVVEHRSVEGEHFVRFRLPRSVDPQARGWTARLDGDHYDRAVASDRLAVRVVPGHPSYNRPAGEVEGAVFGVVAALGDGVLLLLAVVVGLRRRRWAVRRVTALEEDLVTFTLGPMTLTARVEPALLDGLAVGRRLGGRLTLRAETDVLPAGPVGALEHLGGPTYRARGRVADVSRTHTDLQLDNGYRLRVRTAGVRSRADLREPAEVTGTLSVRPGLD